jgi:8-oxo-dGTP pyrophosphatase MutT (NUDIX family)
MTLPYSSGAGGDIATGVRYRAGAAIMQATIRSIGSDMPNTPAGGGDAAKPAREPVPAPSAADDFARRLTDALNRVDRDMSLPNSKPRDAATLIVIDRSGDAPKVLLGRRHARHRFMPGKFVFPGGRVERTDRAVSAKTELDPRVSERLMAHVRRPSLAKARAFAIAAIRETFEETGLVFGAAADAPKNVTAGAAGSFAAAGMRPDLAAMHFIARAITPPRRPRRFDTRFFALDAQMIAGKVEGVVGPDAELVELVWLPLTEAERLDMPAITKTVLAELERRIASGFGHELPAPFYRWLGGRFTRALL